MLVNTADPGFTWEGQLRSSGEGPVGGGRGSPRGTAHAVISGPIVADRVGVRLAVLHDSDGGYFRNRLNGGALGEGEGQVTSRWRVMMLRELLEQLPRRSRASGMKPDLSRIAT